MSVHFNIHVCVRTHAHAWQMRITNRRHVYAHVDSCARVLRAGVPWVAVTRDNNLVLTRMMRSCAHPSKYDTPATQHMRMHMHMRARLVCVEG